MLWLLRLFGFVQDKVAQPQQEIQFLLKSEPPNPNLVKRGTRSIWREKGWYERRNELHGYYRGKRLAYKGFIVNPFTDARIFLISETPTEVLKGRHGLCFKETLSKSWRSVHFYPEPVDAIAGILRIEHTLREAGL